jgi:hypothetical protein
MFALMLALYILAYFCKCYILYLCIRCRLIYPNIADFEQVADVEHVTHKSHGADFSDVSDVAHLSK